MPVTLQPPVGYPTRAGSADVDWSEMLKNQLSDTRKAAENWRNGLIAIVGLVATVTIVKGPSEISGLVKPAAYAVGIFLVFALVSAVAGAWASLRAAYGEPEVISREELDSHGGIVGLRFNLAKVAIRDLHVAQWTTLATVVFLVLAIGITWYGPRPSSPVLVTYGASSVCGYVEHAGNGVLEIRSTSGQIVDVNIGDVSGVRVVDDCEQ